MSDWIRIIDVPRPEKAQTDNARFASRGVFSMRDGAGMSAGSERLVNAVATFQTDVGGAAGRVDGALGPNTARAISAFGAHPIHELVIVGEAPRPSPAGGAAVQPPPAGVDGADAVPSTGGAVGVVVGRAPKSLRWGLGAGAVVLVLGAGLAIKSAIKPKRKRRR